MTDDDARRDEAKTTRDYTTLPPAVPLDETVEGVDTRAGVEPDDVRNVDQHTALRED